MAIRVQRSGSQVVLSFPYSQDAVDAVKHLPYAELNRSDKTWHAAWCAQTVAVLEAWEAQGWISTTVAELMQGEEAPAPCHDGVLLPVEDGSAGFVLWSARRDKNHTSRIRRLPGAKRVGKSNRFRLPAHASGALSQMIADRVVADPQRLLVAGGDAVVAFDTLTGAMVSNGDPRVSVSLERFWPEKDVVAAARAHGVDVQFSDLFSEQVYAGEVARRGEGIQPESVQIPLYEFQKAAVAQICSRGGMGLFLEPGLGKTAVSIGAGAEFLDRGEIERVFVTPPAAVMTQWAEEIQRFTGCSEDDVLVVRGTPEVRKRKYRDAFGAKWVLVNHDLLSRDFDDILPLVDGQFFVVDEAHKGTGKASNGQGSQRGKAMRSLAKISSHRLALTGTPVLNSVLEWHRLMSWLVEPDLFGDERMFKERYQYQQSFNRNVFEGARNLEELRDRSQCHFIRWTKKDVAEHLPPLNVHHMRLDPDKRYAAALVEAHEKARVEISSGSSAPTDDENDPSGMTATGVLRAMCSSPRLVQRSDSAAAAAMRDAGLVPDEDGPKLDEIRVMAAEMQARGERMVVFTYSREMLHLIEERFDEDGIRFVSYHGMTSQKDRDAAVKRFTSPSDGNAGATVFLATDAAAEGLNLGKQCGTVVNFDLPWTAGRLEQRSNRVHRIDGCMESYLVVNLTVAGTIEEGILRMVESKAHISDVLFGERKAQDVTGRGVPRLGDDLADAFRANVTGK